MAEEPLSPTASAPEVGSRPWRIIDLRGQRFGRLTVTAQAPKVGRRITWLCACDCGVVKTIQGNHLSAGRVVSCGCYSRQQASRRAAHTDQSEIAGERWLELSDAPGYFVSDHGRFRGVAGLIMRGRLDKNGYPMVSYRRKTGRVRGQFLHLLVIRAFVGPAPAGKECDHKDRNRANPRLDNLRYVTHQENIDNSAKRVGEDHGGSKLTEAEVREILAIRPAPRWGRRGKGNHPNSVISIARRYGVNNVTVLEIRRGDLWRHVFDDMVASHPHLLALGEKRRNRRRRRTV